MDKNIIMYRYRKDKYKVLLYKQVKKQEIKMFVEC